ncbi:MAG: hypothetical protein WDN26_14065 [Chitinophagaceae bacterium]
MQKGILLFLTIIIISNTVNCQITKDNWMLGGVISYASTNYNSTNYGEPHTTYNLQRSPNIGYFFVNKLAGGLKVGISKTGDKDKNQSYTNFNLGPYFRYYLLASEKQVNVVTEAAYMYGFEKGSTPDKTSKNTFSFSAGPVIYFNNVVGLEMLVSYSTYKFSDFDGSNNTIKFGLGLQVHLEK